MNAPRPSAAISVCRLIAGSPLPCRRARPSRQLNRASPVPSTIMSFPAPSRPGPAELQSTWPQRAWTLTGTAAIVSSFLTCIRLLAASGSTTTELLAAAAAAFAAYALADLATGVYHWLIDNYGDASTPVFGAQIAAFQGHHRRPSTITLREPCNNLHALARAVALVLAPVDAALSARGAPAAVHAFCCAFAASFLLSQQFHAWAHERRGRLPPCVEALQAAGVLVSRAQHAAHHRQPYNTNYCIVSGMWNRVLDKYKVFMAMEMVVFFLTGVRPRSWNETDASWKEEDTGAEATAAGGSDAFLQTASISAD